MITFANETIEIEEAIELIKNIVNMSDDELEDYYYDLGTMGDNMDCSEFEWTVICTEIDRRWQNRK